jgi:hypothetical protein
VEGPYSSPLAGAEANAPQQKPSETAAAGRAKRGRPTKCEVEKAGKRAEGEKAMEGKQRGKSEQQKNVKKEKEETKKTKKTKEDEGEGTVREGQAKKRLADCFQAGASSHE